MINNQSVAFEATMITLGVAPIATSQRLEFVAINSSRERVADSERRDKILSSEARRIKNRK